MKVLYDISVLGLGYYFQRSRTGIFRTIEELAVALMDNKACEINFSAIDDPAKFVLTLKYLRDNSKLNDIDLSYPESRMYASVLKLLGRRFPDPDTKWRKLIDTLIFAASSWGHIKPSQLSSADILHSTFYPLPEYSKRMRKLKRLITIYDIIPVLYPEFFSFHEDHLIKSVLASIDDDVGVISISQSTKNDLCNYLHIDPSRVYVTYLAASDRFYHCDDQEKINNVRARYNLPEGQYILSLGTFEPRKNIDHTIRCFARLVQEQKIMDLNLVLIGTEGWDYEKIHDALTGLSSLRKRILFAGYVDDEDLAPLYSGAMMFVYPSFYEGFGLPPLEAMQCGVPVITSNTSSLPEVAGNAGVLLDPLDSDALCQSMHELYRNPSKRSEMSINSLARARNFSWKKCAQDTIEAYNAAINL